MFTHAYSAPAHRSRRSGALLLAVLFGLVGCGSGTPTVDPADRPAAGGAGELTPPVAGPVLPFDAYRLTDADDAMISAAGTALMRDCMAKKGYGWTRPPGRVGSHPQLAGNARRYGLIDVQAAQRYGYHVPDDPRQTRLQASLADWKEALPEAERQALYGPDGETGCAAEADSRVADGVRGVSPDWFVGLDFGSVDRSAVDPAVVRASGEWRRCMADLGLDYATPQAAVEDLRWRLDEPEVSPQEIAVATADVRCKDQARLVPVRAAAETVIQQKEIAAKPARFAALRQAQDRYRANARKTLEAMATDPANQVQLDPSPR